MVIDDIVYFGVAPQAVRGGPKSPLAVGECSCGCDRSDRKVDGKVIFGSIHKCIKKEIVLL